MTKAKQIAALDLSSATDAELRAYRNLADFNRRGIVIGDRVFVMMLPKVAAELKRRGIKK
jgi:hypothetical protein